MQKPKIFLYLHHVELGQRYPISEDVVIGRQSGQILFPKDERLSAQHCQILVGPTGPNIRDLESKHGTVVDGRLLSPQKVYPIRDGTLIAAGNQVFKCVEPSNRPYKTPVRRKKKKSRSRFDFTPFFAVIFAVAFGALAWRYQSVILPIAKSLALNVQSVISDALKSNPSVGPSDIVEAPPLASPFELVYKDVQLAYDQYSKTGQTVSSGELTGKKMAHELRQNLIPKFVAASTKLAILKPSNELERRRIKANTKLVSTITRQLKAMASFAETKNPKYSKEIEKLTPLVEKAGAEARQVNDLRAPAAH